MYLTAVIDRFSRMVLSWRVSTTLSADFCVDVLQEAVTKFGWPEIFNTDQGCQYTSDKFVSQFSWDGCPTRLSMDSKGRALDNIFIERFWRTIMYEEFYLKGYETVQECKHAVGAYIERYNNKGEHSSLDGNTPSDVYFKKILLKESA